MLARSGRIRVVEARSRFEDDPTHTAAADEIGELLDARHALAPAADLRAQSARGDLIERHALEVDRLVLPLAVSFHDRQRSRLVLRQLGQLRRRPDETAEHPRVLALPRLPVLSE